MQSIASWIDAINEKIGRVTFWLILFMILISAYNAVMRYMSKFAQTNLSSNSLIEIQWYLFSAIFLLGSAYGLKHNSHVRVDVFYEKFSQKKKLWVNIIGHCIFLIPFSLTIIWISLNPIINSWTTFEGSPDPGGLPRYPIKTLVPIAFLLLILQSISNIIKSFYELRDDKRQNYE